MAKQTINLGTPNGKDGDIIRDAFNKVNQNFTELYALSGQSDLVELAQDYAAEMIVDGTHSGIAVTYDDANNKLNFTVPAGFSGAYADLTGTPTIPANINDLGDVALTDPVNGDLLTYFNGSWTNAALLNYVTVGSNISVLNNDAGYITSSNLTGYATELFVTSQGYLTAIPPSIVTDLTGSVFADNSTPLVDAVNGKIVGDIDTSSFTLYGRMTTADLGGGQTTFRTTETNQDGDTVASVWLQSLTTSGMQVINDPAGDSNTLYSTVEVEASAASLTSAVQTVAGDEFARVLVAPGLIQLRAGTPADGTQVWQLNSDGSIEFPDSTIQTTAWTGTASGFTYNEDGGTSEIGVTADVFDFGDGKTIDMQNSTVLFTGSTVSGILSLNTDYITIGVGGSINMQGSDIGAAGTVSAVTVNAIDFNGNLSGTVDGDLTGSVFADNSTLLVDGVNGKIVAPININDNEIFDEAGDTGLNIRSSDAKDNIYIYSYGSDGDGTGAGNIYVTGNGVDIYGDWRNGGVGEYKWSFGGDGTLRLPASSIGGGIGLIYSPADSSIWLSGTNVDKTTDGNGVVLNGGQNDGTGRGGGISLFGGNSTGGTGGSIFIETGIGQGGADNGVISIGTAYAKSVDIGRNGSSVNLGGTVNADAIDIGATRLREEFIEFQGASQLSIPLEGWRSQFALDITNKVMVVSTAETGSGQDVLVIQPGSVTFTTDFYFIDPNDSGTYYQVTGVTDLGGGFTQLDIPGFDFTSLIGPEPVELFDSATNDTAHEIRIDSSGDATGIRSLTGVTGITGQDDQYLYLLTSLSAGTTSSNIAMTSVGGVRNTLNGTTEFGSGATVNFANATVTNWSDPDVVNEHGGSAVITVGAQTATMDDLTVRIVDDTPGALDVEFNYDAGSTVGISANGDAANRFNGIQTFAAGNTTWTTMNVLNTVGDKGEFTIVDHSYHKIYRVTTFARALPGGGAAGDAYCVIERLK